MHMLLKKINEARHIIKPHTQSNFIDRQIGRNQQILALSIRYWLRYL